MTIYVIDVAEGENIPRRGGPGITRSDLLVINKIDLAPSSVRTSESWKRMRCKMRLNRRFVFTDLRSGEEVEQIATFIIKSGGLEKRPPERGAQMGIISRGFSGRRTGTEGKLPPGQYVTADFPVLSAGPTPHVPLDRWEFVIDDGSRILRRWDWKSFLALPRETITLDIHCVTRWSKPGKSWEGVSLDTLLADVKAEASHAFVRSYGDYSTNMPLNDLLNGQAWIAFRFDGKDLAPEHGGPARLLVPHLYFWKSAKSVRRMTLTREDKPGFWESLGYHIYGDPWKEQRYSGDE